MNKDLELCRKTIQTKFDSRFIAFNVDVDITNSHLCINGTVHNHQVLAAFKKELRKAFPKRRIKEEVFILQCDFEPEFAQINVPVAPLLHGPNSRTEQLSQEILGRMVRVYKSKGSYVYAQLSDGYLGWLKKDALVEKSTDEYRRWVTGRKTIVTRSMKKGTRQIPRGTELLLTKDNMAILPDGKKIKFAANSYNVSWPAKNPIRSQLVKLAKSQKGVKYVWGGKSHDGIDCSGFTQLNYEMNGIWIPRDASQQVSVGRMVGQLADRSDILPGDILFFMNEKAKVYHVGLSLGGTAFIHASFVMKGVVIDDLENVDDKERKKKYYSKFLFAKSILM